MDNLCVVISKCPFWKDLTSEEQLTILKSVKLESYRKGESISSYGAIFITSGIVRCYLSTDDGKEITVGHLLPGDIGIMPATETNQGLNFDVNLETTERVSLFKIPLDVMLDIQMHNQRVALFVLRTAVKRYVQTINSMQCVMSRSLEARIAEYLSFRADSNHNLVLRLTHEDIAKCISSSREVVTKAMKKMVADGLVELRRGIVIIKDLKRIKEIQEIRRYSYAC